MKLSRICTAILFALPLPALAAIPTGFVSNATPTNWVTTIADNGTTQNGYAGTYGTITFNDWGYRGPTGVTANDFQVGSGFDAGNVGQIQSVVTVAPDQLDWLTPDPSSVTDGVNSVKTDSQQITYGVNYPLPNANMDGQVNFYEWAYTTPTSTFSNMQIDKAGNYFIAKDDMNFGYYETFTYNNGSVIEDVNTGINFQPYAISDAKGWCGSTMVENPNGLEQMAGQVTFDFAFDAYLFNGSPEGPFPAATQIVPDFVMRSFGDYTVAMGNDAGVDQNFVGSAVGNNFNPVTGVLDEDFQNKVSFLGAGVVPEGVWVLNAGTPDVEIVKECAMDAPVCSVEGATLHSNAFAGYAFLLRADAERTLEFISPEGHSYYVATAPAVVPVPAAVWLFGSGLLGLVGVARNRRTK